MRQKQFCRETGMTVEQFAQWIGVTRSTAAKWQTGHRMPSPYHMKIIHRKTQGRVTPEDYLSLRDDYWKAC